jgi:hypothetical protein
MKIERREGEEIKIEGILSTYMTLAVVTLLGGSSKMPSSISTSPDFAHLSMSVFDFLGFLPFASGLPLAACLPFASDLPLAACLPFAIGLPLAEGEAVWLEATSFTFFDFLSFFPVSSVDVAARRERTRVHAGLTGTVGVGVVDCVGAVGCAAVDCVVGCLVGVEYCFVGVVVEEGVVVVGGVAGVVAASNTDLGTLGCGANFKSKNKII